MPVYLPLVLFLLVVLVALQLNRRPERWTPDMADHVASLKERVRTLEAIITDRDRKLRDDIDRLD